jgi:hypothetical protein
MKSEVMAQDDKKGGSQILAAATKAAKATGGQVVVEIDAEDLEKPEKKSLPKEARIKKAENGYIVCWYDNSSEPWRGERQVVAKDFDEAVSELKKYME